MSAFTDDDVTAAAKAISEAWRNMHTNEALGFQRMLARAVLAAVAPQIAARARAATLDAAIEFAREYENQWGNEPYWYEVAGHLARAEQVEREAAADELSQMTQDNDLDDDDWRADGYDDLRGGYYG